jgi:hypothetical protein
MTRLVVKPHEHVDVQGEEVRHRPVASTVS